VICIVNSEQQVGAKLFVYVSHCLNSSVVSELLPFSFSLHELNVHLGDLL